MASLMPWWGWLLLALWLPGALGAALLIGYSIRLRDRRERPGNAENAARPGEGRAA